MTTKYRVSADIGGTFTDIVIEPSNAPVYVGKVATTPDNPARGVIEGIKELVPDLSDIEFFVHGTTVGLNAFLERKGERVVLVTTEGAGDSFTIARGCRQSLYSLQYKKPEQLVTRSDIHEVKGRLSWEGDELEPLDVADFDAIIEKVRNEKINAIAICFLHAYAYPQHEQQARNILEAALPGVSVSLSSEVASEWREYERASSAVMNAYVAPVVQRYLSSLQAEFRAMGMNETVHIMQSSGGVTSAENASKNPVFTLLSGPVGGTIAGTSLAGEKSGRKNLLCVDMGGTSFDLSVVIDGKANTTLETELQGLPLLMSIVDIQTIGTGGGSIAWLEQGAMRVGPQSAGSQPGPACYGRGGERPTVTDANLYLGRLGAQSLLKGAMSLDEEACNRAIETVAEQASMDPTAFAEGILSISNAAMADAMRTITVSEGLDPREFSLVAFGGAGPMAAVFLAAELDINEVIVPNFPGTFSAWGMLQTDLRQNFTRSYFRSQGAASLDELNSIYLELEENGKQALVEEGTSEEFISYQRSADMRYFGQEYTINVAIEPDESLESMYEDFHEAHNRRYGHANKAAPLEFVNLRVAAFGAINKYKGSSQKDGAQEDIVPGQREAVFSGEVHKTDIVLRDRLTMADSVEGPVIVEEQSATTIIPPGWTAALDETGCLIIRKGTQQ